MRTKHLGINLGRDDFVAHLSKSLAGEEVNFEGQTEQTPKTDRTGLLLEVTVDGMTNSVPSEVVVNGDCAHLAKILPQHMEGTASDNSTCTVNSYPKLKNGFVELDVFFTEEDVLLNKRSNEGLNSGYVRRARGANTERLFGHPSSVAVARYSAGDASAKTFLLVVKTNSLLTRST